MFVKQPNILFSPSRAKHVESFSLCQEKHNNMFWQQTNMNKSEVLPILYKEFD